MSPLLEFYPTNDVIPCQFCESFEAEMFKSLLDEIENKVCVPPKAVVSHFSLDRSIG